MKKAVIIFAFILVNLSLSSQEIESENNTAVSSLSGEEITLFTDRSLYCVNEDIYFTAEYTCINELESLNWSEVLYIELIQWNGVKLAQMKLKLTKPAVSSSIKIPRDLLSGNYYLRAYTKWMRNFSVYEYAYQPIKILNPFRTDTEEGPAELTHDEKELSNTVRSKSVNAVRFAIDKKEISTGERIEVELDLQDNGLSDSDRYCVSVAKVGTVDTTFNLYKPVSTYTETNLTEFEYLPEIRGISISGKVIGKISHLPQKNVTVILSDPQHGEYFSVYHTNDSGRFVFSLPEMHPGQHDFYIQAESTDSTLLEVLIDKSFCSRPIKLPFVAFQLNEGERDLFRDMAVNIQLNERFKTNNDPLVDLSDNTEKFLPFYGSDKTIYRTEKYIELPNFEEFINEIVMEAGLAFNRGKPAFIGMKREDRLFYPPLILMDNIPVDNNDKLLKIPLNRIERVEATNSYYTVAGEKYTGIISIFSKNKDFAGLTLNKNSLFFTYDLFSEPKQNYNQKPPEPRIPNRRNVLYWNPNIQISSDKNTTISFFTSDNRGEYIIFVRDKNNKDDLHIYGKYYFSVK